MKRGPATNSQRRLLRAAGLSAEVSFASAKQRSPASQRTFEDRNQRKHQQQRLFAPSSLNRQTCDSTGAERDLQIELEQPSYPALFRTSDRPRSPSPAKGSRITVQQQPCPDLWPSSDATAIECSNISTALPEQHSSALLLNLYGIRGDDGMDSEADQCYWSSTSAYSSPNDLSISGLAAAFTPSPAPSMTPPPIPPPQLSLPPAWLQPTTEYTYAASEPTCDLQHLPYSSSSSLPIVDRDAVGQEQKFSFISALTPQHERSSQATMKFQSVTYPHERARSVDDALFTAAVLIDARGPAVGRGGRSNNSEEIEMISELDDCPFHFEAFDESFTTL